MHVLATRRWLVVAGICIVVAIAVYVLAVLTPTGQSLENAALRGADQAGSRDLIDANSTLNQITVYSLVLAVVAIAVVGLLRRRWELIVASVGVIVAGQIVTQVLKRYVLTRPPLVSLTGHYAENSLPSGHTTIAMTVLFAALIVIPYRWRGWVLFFVLFWAVGIGAYTLTAKWHRLSDTLVADAISLALACVASWWLARRGLLQRYEGRRRITRVALVVFAALAGLISLVIGCILLVAVLTRDGVANISSQDVYLVYLGVYTIASFGSIAAALVFLATWRKVEIA